MTEDRTPEQHTLTYQGRRDPTIGSPMGPDLTGRIWLVQGSVHNAEHDTTAVTIEEFIA